MTQSAQQLVFYIQNAAHISRLPIMADGIQTPNEDPRRKLASVSVLLEQPAIRQLMARHSRALVLDAIHQALARCRAECGSGSPAPALKELTERVAGELNLIEQARLRPVVNATGIILHTGLGRAVLPQRAVDALAGLNRCCNIQIDLETGLRGKRTHQCTALLRKLTGAESATIVNNNAAATLLLLSTLAKGREVIISRGQLIEIGGSYRLPDCIHQSGAKMVEVGTTNKTHLRDYEQAITENTAMILRVNPSNYRVVGFSQEVAIAELAALKNKYPILVVDDLGCGALMDLQPYGLPKEPLVQESLQAGADLVCFSGDKLIGGPQAGIILGKKELIDRLKKHPLSRMLRTGKLTDVALEQTLRLFLEPETLLQNNPTLRMLTRPLRILKNMAGNLKSALDALNTSCQVAVIQGESATGGGALPAVPIPTWLLAVTPRSCSPAELSRRLRLFDPPIITRTHQEAVHFDMRTLLDGESELVLAALKTVCLEAP